MRALNLPALLLAPFQTLARHRALVVELTRREVDGRYRGASLGVLWSLLSPFLLIAIYTIAFGTVMGGRWPEVEAAGTPFSIVMFGGMIPYFVLSECMLRSPELVVGNPSYVKRVVFPLEILPWPMVLSALFHSLMNVVVFLILRLWLDGAFTWTFVLLPLVLLPLVVLALGVSWFLAALAVYFRDVRQVTGVLSMALLFLSSAMMPLQSVPEAYRWVFVLNPLTFIIDQARNVLVWGVMPDWAGLALYLAGALVVLWGGWLWFRATSKGFADVL